jgi:hypothetical protein
MSASDSTVVWSIIDGALDIYDGSTNHLSVGLVKAVLKLTISLPKWQEATSNAKHLSTPTVRNVGDGTIKASLTALVATLKGNASVSLFEALTCSGGASSWTTTGAGDRKLLRMVVTMTGGGSGATQTITLGYCVTENIQIDPAGEGGLASLSVDITDLENLPTIA